MCERTNAVLQENDFIRLLLLLHSATLHHDAEQQATRGAGADASEMRSTVKAATSQVTLAIKIESAEEAAAAPQAAEFEAPNVGFSPEKADAAVTVDAETAAATPTIAGLEAPDETASSQEADVTTHENDGKATDLEATDETTSSWVADVAEKENVDEAAAAKEADKGQTAQSERQRVYLAQAIGRSVSHRPLVVASMVCATPKQEFQSLSEGMTLQACVPASSLTHAVPCNPGQLDTNLC